jgi:DNA-binding NarL/FixJ family response regulator
LPSCSGPPASGASGSARTHQAIATLTPREREVLGALAAGVDSHAIADQLKISIRTERNHVARILIKLGVQKQVQGAEVQSGAGQERRRWMRAGRAERYRPQDTRPSTGSGG